MSVLASLATTRAVTSPASSAAVRARAAPVLGAAVRHDAVSSTSASLPSSAPLASLALAASSAASLAAVPAAHAATLMADVGEDIFASTGVGPALCVVGTIYIGYVVFSGYETIKRLKEELTDMGYDVEEFNRVGELKAIKNAVEEGTVDGIFDKVWYQRASSPPRPAPLSTFRRCRRTGRPGNQRADARRSRQNYRVHGQEVRRGREDEQVRENARDKGEEGTARGRFASLIFSATTCINYRRLSLLIIEGIFVTRRR